MKQLARILRYLLASLVLAASLALLWGWWMLHRTLPQLDGSVVVPELKQEVEIGRDQWGVPHIQAKSLEDLLVAQGYVLAQDRLWQMDLLRRAAAGELSEIFGEAALETDRENRTLGFRAAAERNLALMPAEHRAILEAYARGVNRYIEERRERLPGEFLVLRYEPRPWSPVDTLLINAYFYRELTNFWKDEIRRATVTERAGPDYAHDLFASESPWDHPLVGVIASDKSPAPIKSSNGGKHFPTAEGFSVARAEERTDDDALPAAPPTTWQAADGILGEFADEARAAAGSNNWVVGGKHTYSGKPILANDTHLPLDVPSIWYMIHLTAPGWNVKGFAFPGAPLVIIGHNDRIAWGVTNTGADIQDLYIETFNPDAPNEYRVNGRWVPAQIRRETIRVRGRQDEVLDVVVTRHGPIVRRDGQLAYALRWTATEPGALEATFPLLGKAQNWSEFREALRGLWGPMQNIVYADVDGNIGFIAAARVPIRRKPTGGVPVPGDTDEYEWTGFIPFEDLPQLYNPPEGLIATANGRIVGPKYSYYLTDNWMAPYRTGRIYDLLSRRKTLRPADCITIQTDVLSPPHRQIAEQLLAAGARVRPVGPRTRSMLGILPSWNGRAETNSEQMSFLEFTRRALLWHLLRPRVGAGVGIYQWQRASVFLENVLRDHPDRWLPPGFHNYDELLMTSADLAVQQMELESRRRDPSEWTWGTFSQLRMFHPLGQRGLLRRHLSIGPIGISGSLFSVKQVARKFAPSMRFVADLANFDNSLMNITLGESGQYLSEHYRDQFPSWYEGRGIAAEFSNALVEKMTEHRLRLRPAAP